MMNFILATLIAHSMHPVAMSPTVYCAQRDVVLKQLKILGKKRYSIALARNKLIETWVNSKTLRWSMTATSTKGQTCVLTYGSDFIIIYKGSYA